MGSDDEEFFVSTPVLKYLKKKNVDYNIVTIQKKKNISIINMFIRILHDYLRENKPITDSMIYHFLRT
jgi:hypothetical protein